jgi:adenosine kinase
LAYQTNFISLFSFVLLNYDFIHSNSFLTSYFQDNTSSLLHVARRSAEEDKTFMFNLSAVYLVQFFMDNIMVAMPFCDFVFCNEAEARTFGEMKNWGNDVSIIALRMAGLPKTSGTRPRTVIVTQGGDPTVVASMGKVATYPVDPVAPESLIDINGAGDAFVGGFTSKLIIGSSSGVYH